MEDYKAMYYHLFNATTEAIEHMQKALILLVAAQNRTEDIYIDNDEEQN